MNSAKFEPLIQAIEAATKVSPTSLEHSRTILASIATKAAELRTGIAEPTNAAKTAKSEPVIRSIEDLTKIAPKNLPEARTRLESIGTKARELRAVMAAVASETKTSVQAPKQADQAKPVSREESDARKFAEYSAMPDSDEKFAFYVANNAAIWRAAARRPLS